jgi:hypothetical protein
LFDEEFTKKWLKDKLGIQDRQILVTNAILRTIDNKDAFGLTEIIADSILNRDSVNFTFSRLAGRGIGFHEAWHYVNLLMHDRQ